MRGIVVCAFAVLLFVLATEARLGIDVSSLWSQSSWDCIRKKDFEFAIVRCYRSLNIVDDACAESVRRAWAAGFKHVDLYMFPCPKCKDPAGQVKRLEEHIRAKNITYERLWIDIEGADKYWHHSKDENRKVLSELCHAATENFGTRFAGLYVSHHSWKDILGLDYKEWGNLSVWYAYWDHQPGMGHWQPYGSFTKPYMHQYYGSRTMCDMHIDSNYAE